jgi:glycine/D-amino acid oxidase-like deaminating enzyme
LRRAACIRSTSGATASPLTSAIWRGRPSGFYLACGLSGTGFKTSPAAGASLVELILDGAPKTVDITPFRFERFAEGKLIEGEYGWSVWK